MMYADMDVIYEYVKVKSFNLMIGDTMKFKYYFGNHPENGSPNLYGKFHAYKMENSHNGRFLAKATA